MNEINPFTDDIVAQEWIRSVENEQGLIRDRDIYPLLADWSQQFNNGTIVEIGAGQGICSSKIRNDIGYVGIEPSIPLVTRAIELYGGIEQRKFIIGDAYKIPLKDKSAQGVFSVNVWFHLGDLDQATCELSRILAPNGEFLIITAHPDAYDSFWEKCYSDVTRDGKMMVGKANIPVNPLSKNTFFRHSMDEIETSLKNNDLSVGSIQSIGKIENDCVFIAISGKKKY